MPKQCAESIIMSKMIEDNNISIQDAIETRWEKELQKGIIKFDPRDKNQYKEKKIGIFTKRIIPDRMFSDGEILSDTSTPVFTPFCNNKNFNYNKAPESQELFRLIINNLIYRFCASNSPLSISPHILLVPLKNRPQFIKFCDIKVIFEIIKKNQEFNFVYSSMGAGASVNHMHIHLISGKEYFPVLNSRKKLFSTKNNFLIKTLVTWPSDAYILVGKNQPITQPAYNFIKFLQINNIPHNLFIRQNEIWVNPRSRITSKIMPNKKFGSWETILGIFNACSKNEYFLINGKIFNNILEEIRIDTRLRNKIENFLLKI